MENFSQQYEQEHLAEDMLNEYLDGYLTPEERASVDKHLDECPTCAAHFQQLQKLFADLEELPEVPLERDFRRQILRTINEKPQIPVFIKWSMLPQLAIALFVLLTFLPKYLKGWLVIMPKVINLPVDLKIFNWVTQSKEWFGSLQFSTSAWQFSSLHIGLQFPGLNNINWLLYAVVFVLLLIANGYLLRQVARNSSR